MSYPTPLYYHFIFALELKHIADWQDRKNNDNELCINENLNLSLSNFGKLVRLRTPECYLSCSWQETLRLVLVKMGSVSVPNRTVLRSIVDHDPDPPRLWWAQEGEQWKKIHNLSTFTSLNPFLELMWDLFGRKHHWCKRKVLNICKTVVKYLVWLNPGCVYTWTMTDKQETGTFCIFQVILTVCVSYLIL